MGPCRLCRYERCVPVRNKDFKSIVGDASPVACSVSYQHHDVNSHCICVLQTGGLSPEGPKESFSAFLLLRVAVDSPFYVALRENRTGVINPLFIPAMWVSMRISTSVFVWKMSQLHCVRWWGSGKSAFGFDGSPGQRATHSVAPCSETLLLYLYCMITAQWGCFYYLEMYYVLWWCRGAIGNTTVRPGLKCTHALMVPACLDLAWDQCHTRCNYEPLVGNDNANLFALVWKMTHMLWFLMRRFSVAITGRHATRTQLPFDGICCSVWPQGVCFSPGRTFS